MLHKFIHIYFLPCLLSLGYTIGLGFWDYLLEAKDVIFFILIFIFNIFFFIYIQQCKNRALKNTLSFICLLLIFYISTATGFLQGHMSLGIIASVFQTNHNEAMEFISVIGYQYWLYSFILFVLSIFYFYFYQIKYHVHLNKYCVYALLILNISSIFILQVAHATVKYKKEEKELLSENTQSIDWKIKKIQSHYQNHVVIIGESVQRDYLSLYGYEKKTTPFLDQMPLTIVDDYISTAPNTATSLTRTLAYVGPQHEIKIALNAVTLAKQAGFNTIWISNQGFLGKRDTAISKIAIHADHQIFLKSGNYMSNNFDDEKLLTLLDQELKEHQKTKNVIFIHMMGSHPDACERLFESPRLYPDQPESINCYLSSLNKLDHFIEKSYHILKASQQSFNLTYFSDHGMTVTEDSYHVDNNAKNNYQVPFFVLNSDAKVTQHLKKTVSAYDFLNIYAGLIGVESEYLDSKRHLETIEDNQNVTVFDWNNYVPYKSLKDD